MLPVCIRERCVFYSVRSLELQTNTLCGTLPATFTALASLTELLVNDNQLTITLADLAVVPSYPGTLT
jgi:hypothetical protein